jgi:5,10-methylenetetrahydromethanopterin reductase
VTPADNRGVARGFCRLNNHAEVIPDWLVDKFAIAGTVDQCRGQIARIKRTGIQQIAIIPYSPPGGSREETFRGFAKAMG